MAFRPPPSDLVSMPDAAQAAETLAQADLDASAPIERGATPVPAPALSGPSRPIASLAGMTFDGYEILAELGRGGMGVVYKAHQKSLDRLVALKMLLADHFQDPVRLARFLAEARASASLNHPNIVQVYNIGECAAGHYFAMELIDGQPLEAVLQRGKVRVSAAVRLVTVLAEAVHYAHTRNVIHRDLKPANIMIDVHRRPVIMDFGIAKVLGKSASLTQQGVVMGTPAYMAPEQAGEHLDQVGPHSDVYSLAAILYTLLTGRVTFDEGSPLRTVLKVISDEMPPSVRSLRPEVPEALERICMKGLSKAPADRYPSAHALADHLRRFRAGAAGKGKPTRSPKAGATPVRNATPTVILTAPATGKQIRLSQAWTMVGRSSECDLVLKSSDVSKQHCQILITPDEVVVEDLASANGIQVNGKAVQRARLQDGDRLTIVRYEFQVRLPKG